MRPDAAIKCDVETALGRDADVDATGLSVKVTNGVVTLSGHVSRIFQKHQAARAARFVAGVTAIANDIVVRSQSQRHYLCIARVRGTGEI